MLYGAPIYDLKGHFRISILDTDITRTCKPESHVLSKATKLSGKSLPVACFLRRRVHVRIFFVLLLRQKVDSKE